MQNAYVRFGSPYPVGESQVFKVVADSYGHVAESHEWLLSGDELSNR